MNRVSVIVPCYNVEAFLDDCLRSVVRQTHQELQIIVIDDGSDDETGNTVERWAEHDGRIIPVHQLNAGLGAARNRALELVDADWLFFLDSDDLLPPDAVARMVTSGAASGSDFVSGVAERFNATRRWRSGMYRSSFHHDVRGTHVFRRTDLLYDHIACSKLFRSAFWRANDFRFPEGVVFEDIELVTRAHCVATSVDLISTPTYFWRERITGVASITQDRTYPGSTAARYATLGRLDAYLAAEAPAHVWDAHATKVFSLDAPAYCALVGRADHRYLIEFTSAAQPVAISASRHGLVQLVPLHRQLWEALATKDVDVVAHLGHFLGSIDDRSISGIVSALWSLHGAAPRRAAVAELGRAARTVQVEHAPQAKAAGIKVLRSLAAGYERGAAAVRPTTAPEKIDVDLRRIAWIERRARSLSRIARLTPRRTSETEAGLPPPDELGLVGGLRAALRVTREGVGEIRFSDCPVRISRVHLVHPGEKLRVEVPRDRDRFVVDFERMRRFGAAATFRPTTWHLVAEDVDGGRWAVLGDGGDAVEHVDGRAGARYRITAGPTGMSLHVLSLLPATDRGAVAQSVIQANIRRRAANGERRNTVFYECYYGRSVGCHPRAIYERLAEELSDWDHVFALQPGFHRPPDGVSSALRWTRSYHELLQTSRVVVANCELHPGYRRAPHQVVVQTWHGTPLKRIGLDIDTPRLRNASYQADLARQAAQWSFVVSPTQETDSIFPGAFSYDGSLLQAGSPRNDRIVRADSNARAQIRMALGIGTGVRAVLFAPTFRDNAHTSTGYRATPGCDLEALVSRLPERAVVLFRAHSNVRVCDIPWSSDTVINVSDYPDMQDLIVAADILVTDYSSTMFDWSLTGRPLVLYAPDLAEYRDTRDFYFEYESAMPVAVATTPDEFEEHLRAASSGTQFDLTDFRTRFSGRDDGCATDRVCDEILRRLD